MSMQEDTNPQRGFLAQLLTKLIRGGQNPWGSGPVGQAGAFPATPPVGPGGMTDMSVAGPWGAGIPTNSGGGEVPVPQARPEQVPVPQARPYTPQEMPVPQARPEDALRMPATVEIDQLAGKVPIPQPRPDVPDVVKPTPAKKRKKLKPKRTYDLS